jgi:hypothetical protein
MRPRCYGASGLLLVVRCAHVAREAPRERFQEKVVAANLGDVVSSNAAAAKLSS